MSDTGRNIRAQTFCWQEKTVLRLLRESFAGQDLTKLRNLYVTLTEIQSDFYQQEIKHYTETIATYSGLSNQWIPKGLKILEELAIIEITENRDENGQYSGRTIKFTDREKTVNGSSTNGSSSSGYSQHKNILKDYKNIQYEVSVDTYMRNEAILHFMKAEKIFNHRLPETPSENSFRCTKTVHDAILYMEQVRNHTFVLENSLEAKYGPLEITDPDEDIKRALLNIKLMRNKDYFPYDKKNLPRSLPAFFLNTHTGTSWFIIALRSNPRKLDQNDPKYTEIATDTRMNLFISWFDMYHMSLTEKQLDRLEKYIYDLGREYQKIFKNVGEYYIKTSNWASYLGRGDLDTFFEFYVNYLKDHGDPYVGRIRIESETWKNFVDYMKREFGFNFYARDLTIQNKIDIIESESSKNIGETIFEDMGV